MELKKLITESQKTQNFKELMSKITFSNHNIEINKTSFKSFKT